MGAVAKLGLGCVKGNSKGFRGQQEAEGSEARKADHTNKQTADALFIPIKIDSMLSHSFFIYLLVSNNHEIRGKISLMYEQ